MRDRKVAELLPPQVVAPAISRSGSALRSVIERGMRREEAMICCGIPSTATMVVRRLSCRATMPSIARRNASTSRTPLMRILPGEVVRRSARVKLVEEPETLLSKRQWNGGRRIAPGNSLIVQGGGPTAQESQLQLSALRPDSDLRHLGSHHHSLVGSAVAIRLTRNSEREACHCWASQRWLRSGSSMPKAARARAMSWVALNECPPRSKKSSSTPTRGTRSTSAHIWASKASIGVRGAIYGCSNIASPCSCSGSALRSSLPLGVNGRLDRKTNAEGTITVGSRSARKARSSVA